MKKRILVLGMILAMVLGLCACGSAANNSDTADYVTEDEAYAVLESTAEMLAQIVEAGQVQEFLEYYKQSGMDVSAYESGFASWESSASDLGTFIQVESVDSNTLKADYSEGIITGTVSGTDRNATLEIIISKGDFSSITVNVNYSFGELMKKAGLNTLLGMGTVFIVLILIAFIISLFGFIPKIQDALKNKNAKEDLSANAVDHTIQQIIEKEELSDDLELVAVISAAIAASEGASSTDGFVVRSIRRSNKRQRA